MSDNSLSIQTGNSVLSYKNGSDSVSDTAALQNGNVQIPRTVKEYSVTTETKTAVASNPNNFIFVGKGYGHGAGLSQYGAKTLADLGYDYEHIINAYFTGVEIVYYKTLEEFR